jgi:hypothetical protein
MKGSLNTLTYVLTYFVSCLALQLTCPFVRSCFGHAMLTVTQSTIDDIKVCVSLSKVSLKEVESSLQNTIIWTNKFGMGQKEWKESCIIAGLLAKMLKTLDNEGMICFSSNLISRHWNIKMLS